MKKLVMLRNKKGLSTDYRLHQSLKTDRLSMISIKLNEDDLAAISANAAIYALGNLSAWLRHAGKFYRPRKGEQVLKKRYK